MLVLSPRVGALPFLCSLADMADAAQVPSEREQGVGRERAPGHDAEGDFEYRPEDSAVDSAAPTPAGPLELTQQERAEATLRSIMSGGNLTAETMRLSNDFTDRHVSRLKSFFRRGK
ncbi:hypothetical protein GCM10027427_17170 [Pseudoclavibacter terrae]